MSNEKSVLVTDPTLAELSAGENTAAATDSDSAPAVAETGQSSRRIHSSKGRWIHIAIAAIKAVLLLELAGVAVRPLVALSSKKQQAESEEESDSDFDPADVLVDYLTGKTGLAAVQLLSTDQLREAVDNMITEDYDEIGVTDRGAEIRKIVEQIIEARDKGVADTPMGRQQQQRVGLGRVGPLRFRNSKHRDRSSKPGPEQNEYTTAPTGDDVAAEAPVQNAEKAAAAAADTSNTNKEQ